MAFCTQCGQHTEDGARFCSGCGRPLGQTAPAQQPERRRPVGLIILAAATALAVAIAVASWWFTRPDPDAVGDSAPAPTSTSTSTTPSSVPTSSASTSTSSSTSSSATSTTDAETSAALAQLNRMRSDSLGGLDLDGRWVLQMSSKADGTVDPMQRARNGSHTFHLPDILADHQRVVDTLSETPVLLLKASDFGKQNLPDGERYWVTVVDPGASSREEALDTCRAIFGWDGLTEDQLKNRCLPRRLTSPS